MKMISIETLRSEIESSLANIKWNKPPMGLYTPIEYSIALGGKRVRPVMCLALELGRGIWSNVCFTKSWFSIFTAPFGV